MYQLKRKCCEPHKLKGWEKKQIDIFLRVVSQKTVWSGLQVVEKCEETIKDENFAIQFSKTSPGNSVQKDFRNYNWSKFCKDKNDRRNTSNSSYGPFTKKDFGEEHCFKSVDRLKNEYNRRVTKFSKKSKYYSLVKQHLVKEFTVKLWMWEVRRHFICGISNPVT